MYGKLVNGELIYAPQNLTLDDGTCIVNFNRSITKMLEYGFKPVIDGKPGYNFNTQYCTFVEYKETPTCIQFKWEVKNIEFTEEEIKIQETKKAMDFLDIDLQEQIQTLPAEQALEVKSLYPVWVEETQYYVGFMVVYSDVLYKVIQSHTSQADWTPDISPSLFAKVLVGEIDPDTGEQEILDWVQPDSTNPYMMGDKVMFEGCVYESVIDNNVWSPTVYPAGWRQVEV